MLHAVLISPYTCIYVTYAEVCSGEHEIFIINLYLNYMCKVYFFKRSEKMLQTFLIGMKTTHIICSAIHPAHNQLHELNDAQAQATRDVLLQLSITRRVARSNALMSRRTSGRNTCLEQPLPLTILIIDQILTIKIYFVQAINFSIQNLIRGNIEAIRNH